MPLQFITAPVTRNTKPSFVIDILGTDPIQLRGAGREIDHDVRPNFEDVETFDNPGGEAPGVTPEAFNVEVISSHGALGLFNLLTPFADVLTDFAYQVDADAVNSAANPEYSGQLYVPKVPIISAGVRKFSVFTLEFKISGIPVVTSSGIPVYAAHA